MILGCPIMWGIPSFQRAILSLAVFTLVAECSHHYRYPHKKSDHGMEMDHGGVPMGTPNTLCDDGLTDIEIDWDPYSDEEYTCFNSDIQKGDDRMNKVQCEERAKSPIHVCYPREIPYSEDLPTSGAHRPLWPRYGEYIYLPVQRWLHSLEHGAIVFLYHPCADPDEIEEFKAIARSCLRRHVISPYKKMPSGVNFAVLAWTCKLTLGSLDMESVVQFVQAHALKAPEGSYTKDGQYSVGLVQPAHIVSDVKDSRLCPSFFITKAISNKIEHDSERRMKLLGILDKRLQSQIGQFVQQELDDFNY